MPTARTLEAMPRPRSLSRTILVSLDGSPFAEAALPVARSLSERLYSRLEVARVEADGPNDDAGGPVPDQGRAGPYLDDVRRRLLDEGGVEVEASLLHGSTHHALLARAEELDADLLVMATHGRGPVSRFWLGSVADAVVRRARVPVLLVRPRGGGEGAGAGPDPARSPDLAHILIPLDGSDVAERIVERITHLGEALGATYTLVRVVELPPVPSLLEEQARPGHGWLDEARRSAGHDLAQVASRMRRRGLQVAEEVVVDRHVYRGILDAVRDTGAGMIAMATHARGAAGRFLLGSVAHRVVRAAEVPVVLFRPEGVRS